jgi:uncharacterized protein (UPF0218 family)
MKSQMQVKEQQR